MLRPATPLTILLFAAFALLLISILSTPIIKGIPLASYGGVNFGVFGYCQGSTCSKIEIGYNTADLYSDSQNGSFDLPVSTRTTLSAILILHPVAAFFTLVMMILAAVSHVHSPSHSARYLLGMFLLSILTLLLALLSFLIDVLLFVPHMAWGSYLVLAATILIAASGLVSCAMRRAVVGRKARAKRIAENAEMNGENFYARQAAEPLAPLPAPAPLVSGPGADKLPSFATFETSNREKDRTSDERIPLTARTPSERSPGGTAASLNGAPEDRYGVPPRMGGAPGMNNSRYNGPPPRDEYGNPVSPSGGYGQPGTGRDPSQERMMSGYPPNGNYRGRGGPPGGFRGRGGPGYGRGGSNPNMRGDYGQPGSGRGGPNGMMGPMAAGAMMRGGRGPPPGYPNGSGRPTYRGESPGGSYGPSSRGPAPGPPGGVGYGSDGYGPYNGGIQRDSLPRAESPPPLEMEAPGIVGQAVEMDATTGSPSHAPSGFGSHIGGLRDSDSDVAGMVGLQQQHANLGHHDTRNSDISHYSAEPYIPPRQAWTGQRQGGASSPLRSGSRGPAMVSPTSPTHRRQSSGDNYYEDVDPRFAEPIETPISDGPPIPASHIPPSLTPGYQPHPVAANDSAVHRDPSQYLNPASNMDGNNSYEDIHEGARSPAESDRSNFTSVSQRGVNPRWNPGMGPGGFGTSMASNGRRPVPPPQQRNDILLDSNPDFGLPGVRPGRGPSNPATQRRPLPTQNGTVPRSAYDGGSAM